MQHTCVVSIVLTIQATWRCFHSHGPINTMMIFMIAGWDSGFYWGIFCSPPPQINYDVHLSNQQLSAVAASAADRRWEPGCWWWRQWWRSLFIRKGPGCRTWQPPLSSKRRLCLFVCVSERVRLSERYSSTVVMAPKRRWTSSHLPSTILYTTAL